MNIQMKMKMNIKMNIQMKKKELPIVPMLP
jgi:hypothetical protein